MEIPPDQNTIEIQNSLQELNLTFRDQLREFLSQNLDSSFTVRNGEDSSHLQNSSASHPASKTDASQQPSITQEIQETTKAEPAKQKKDGAAKSEPKRSLLSKVTSLFQGKQKQEEGNYTNAFLGNDGSKMKYNKEKKRWEFEGEVQEDEKELQPPPVVNVRKKEETSSDQKQPEDPSTASSLEKGGAQKDVDQLLQPQLPSSLQMLKRNKKKDPQPAGGNSGVKPFKLTGFIQNSPSLNIANESFQSQMTSMQELVDNLETSASGNKNKVSEILQQYLTQLKLEIQQIPTRSAPASSEKARNFDLTKLSSDFRQLGAEVEGLKKFLRRDDQEVTRHQQRLQELVRNNRMVLLNLEGLKRAYQSLQAQLKHELSQKSQIEAQIREQYRLNEELRANLLTQENALKIREEDAERSRKALQATKDAHSKKLSELQVSVEKAQLDKSKQEAQLKQLRHTIEQLKSDREEARAQKSKVERELKQIQIDHDILRQKEQWFLKDKDQIYKILEEKENEHSQIQASLETQQEDLQARLRERERDLEDLQQERSQLLEQLDSLSQETQLVQEQAQASLSQGLEHLRTNILDLEAPENLDVSFESLD